MFWYGLVGASGVLVNLCVLTVARWLLPHWPTVTYGFAVEASILTNYVLNARLTFHKRITGRALLQYNLVSLLGAVIQTGIYRCLLHQGLHYVWADLIAIPFATGVGFLLSNVWVFRSREVPSDGTGRPGEPEASREPRPQRSGGHS